ncbi:MAG TPA: hypothetical protein PLA51_01605 [Spirochaetota bacterium]|jgi:hypothetical protein|nr:hypothetical protein [Spirochaetota bacterium]HON15150.1 hypothetical protein [Spirochaetota bacterium]HPD78651.1 hypothetical protein [Spirochaetota bacterium]HRS61800.1 hypothetical protein [Spirochaetota bacterium]HRU64578.1 hypothetical protein [Spirochaetota bacterium]
MSLKKEEIDELIRKLRAKYTEYSQKHNKKWFDPSSFEERLSMAIKNKMNLEGFILAEISNFEKLKEKYEKKKKEKENSFSKEVEKIIEENNARIKKYPEIIFHHNCDMELSHFYGSLNEFISYYFPIFWILATDNQLKNTINILEEQLSSFALKKGDKHPRRIEDHILLLKRPGVRPIEIEKDKNDYLKEGGFLLHDIIDLCDSMIEMKNEEWNYPIQFRKLFIEEERRKKITDNFKAMTGYGAILKVKEQVSSIIEDFRLKAFKRNN